MRRPPGQAAPTLATLAVAVAVVFALAAAAAAAPAALAQSEIPESFEPVREEFDHERRVVEIPMRDGVRLHTVILVPKGAMGAKAAPILLTRTPYDADSLTGHAESSHLGPVLQGYDNATDVIVEGGYIRVVQDVRGKHGSEGDYVMNRPLSGPQNPTAVDHSTDTWDTVEWLVENVPESNGRVGILGISYDGFLPLMALVDPHPALRVAVPMNPMVDGWLGDDWFHYGAFRQTMMGFIYNQQATRKSEERWWSSHFDLYDTFLEAGSAGELGRRRGLEQLGFWRNILAHPTYDAFWQDQAVDRVLAARPLEVPAVMLVHGWWDQEDIYGALAVYRALEPKDTGNDRVFLVVGPWNHGQQIHDGSSLGAIRFGSDTARTFRQEILRPFLDQHLKPGAPAADVAPVMAFETGSNRWERLPAWPAGCAEGCAVEPTPLYLGVGPRAGFAAPAAGEPGRAAPLPLRPAGGEPRLPPRPPHHRAGAVELVPALRPQPADLRREHLLGAPGGLPQGDPARVPRAGAGEPRRAAAGGESGGVGGVRWRRTGVRQRTAGGDGRRGGLTASRWRRATCGLARRWHPPCPFRPPAAA